MGRRGRLPLYAKPPSRGMLDTLPAELLHNIFGSLDPEDILATRETCSILAAIGAEYILDEAAIYHKREKFVHLLQIARHEKFSKKVKSLYYQGDRFPCGSSADYKTFEDWNDERRPTDLPKGIPDLPGVEFSPSPRYQRAFTRAINKNQEERKRMKNSYDDAELTEAYQQYVDLVQDQRAIERERFDLDCLQELFESCPNMKRVTLAFWQSTRRRLRTQSAAFAPAMIQPHADYHWEDQGIQQLNMLAGAVQGAGRQLKDLTLDTITHRIFEGQSTGFTRRLFHLVKPLRRLRINIRAWPEDESVGAEDDMLVEAGEAFDHGTCREMLSHAKQLRILKLHFPVFYGNRATDLAASHEFVLGGLTWPHLTELGLANLVTTDDQLTDLLLAHRHTLRRLTLSRIDLARGTWGDLFKELGGKFPALRKVKLRDYFNSDEMGLEFDFDIADPVVASEKISPCRDALENYLIKGGEWPDFGTLEVQTVYPWEEDGYVPPGLPEEPFETEDADMYEWDEFDYTM